VGARDLLPQAVQYPLTVSSCGTVVLCIPQGIVSKHINRQALGALWLVLKRQGYSILG
jgi:hypothetical protein